MIAGAPALTMADHNIEPSDKKRKTEDSLSQGKLQLGIRREFHQI